MEWVSLEDPWLKKNKKERKEKKHGPQGRNKSHGAGEMLCVEGSNQAPLWPLCRLDCSELSCVVIGKCCCHTCLFFALPWDHYPQALLWGCWPLNTPAV